jgi:hypothetical protein
MNARQAGAVAGIVGPAIFVVISLIGGWVQPGYSVLSDYVSALSLGDHGGCRSQASLSLARAR